jgi:hypothetical protein
MAQLGRRWRVGKNVIPRNPVHAPHQHAEYGQNVIITGTWKQLPRFTKHIDDMEGLTIRLHMELKGLVFYWQKSSYPGFLKCTNHSSLYSATIRACQTSLGDRTAEGRTGRRHDYQRSARRTCARHVFPPHAWPSHDRTSPRPLFQQDGQPTSSQHDFDTLA